MKIRLLLLLITLGLTANFVCAMPQNSTHIVDLDYKIFESSLYSKKKMIEVAKPKMKVRIDNKFQELSELRIQSEKQDLRMKVSGHIDLDGKISLHQEVQLRQEERNSVKKVNKLVKSKLENGKKTLIPISDGKYYLQVIARLQASPKPVKQ